MAPCSKSALVRFRSPVVTSTDAQLCSVPKQSGTQLSCQCLLVNIASCTQTRLSVMPRRIDWKCLPPGEASTHKGSLGLLSEAAQAATQEQRSPLGKMSRAERQQGRREARRRGLQMTAPWSIRTSPLQPHRIWCTRGLVTLTLFTVYCCLQGSHGHGLRL